MRVLNVIPGIAPRYGGPSRAIVDMSLALSTIGIESLIATTDADGPSRLSVELGRPIMYQNTATIFFSRQISEAFKYSYPMARWLSANVRRFDLVHIDALFSHSSVAAARACRRAGIPYLIRPLGSLSCWSLRHKPLRKKILLRLQVMPMLRGAAAIHYTTDEERMQAESILSLGRGVIVPLGVDDRSGCASMPLAGCPKLASAVGDHPYVLVLSRLHPVKGLETFLKVFVAVTSRPALQHWRVIVAGAGAPGYTATLQRFTKSLAGHERVQFVGWLNDTEKNLALQHAALLALPSLHESFGLAAVEAMAFGVPVLISSAVNLAKDVSEFDAGWITPLGELDMTATLLAALSSRQERQSRGAAAKALAAARYCWPAVAQQLARLYRSIVDRPAHCAR